MTVNIIQHATDEPNWYDDDGDLTETGLASIPLTLLTLARARQELRVPTGADGQDPLIRNLIKSAVSYVGEDLNIPIVQESVYVVLAHGQLDRPIRFVEPDAEIGNGDPYVLYADKVRYESPDVDVYTFGDWPNEIEIGESQIAPGKGDGDMIAQNIIIKHPDGTWPEAAQNQYAVFYIRGIKDTYPDIDAIRSLVILKMRELFYGTPIMKGQENNTAYERIAKIVRFYGVTHPLRRLV